MNLQHAFKFTIFADCKKETNEDFTCYFGLYQLGLGYFGHFFTAIAHYPFFIAVGLAIFQKFGQTLCLATQSPDFRQIHSQFQRRQSHTAEHKNHFHQHEMDSDAYHNFHRSARYVVASNSACSYRYRCNNSYLIVQNEAVKKTSFKFQNKILSLHFEN